MKNSGKTKWFLAAAVAALMIAPMAHAEGPGKGDGGHKGKMLEKMDSDGDGKVSRAEFIEAHEQRFTEIDADGDGFASAEELKAAWEAKHAQMKEHREQRRDKMKEKQAETQSESTESEGAE
ncbi:MAG: hypothetical protein H6867_05305 [Rhodospirillales bacterium]|nr:hypothetical protein [Rhodospirillales bacterium]MCB9994946.1 hypothetical protein [Rhodospirillales bacterium]